MPSTFEQFVVFGVMSVLVLLFASIYARERNRKYGLWMLGWMAILVHFSIPLVTHWYAVSGRFSKWSSLTTVLVAGTCFLLSVSDVYRGRRRFIFVGSISCSALLYLTAYMFRPLPRFGYVALLAACSAIAVHQVIRRHGWRQPYLYLFMAIVVPACVWAMVKAMQGFPVWGFYVCLSLVFILTGVQYWRQFRRFSSGVVLTSIGFVCWGLVFPVAAVLLKFQLVAPHPFVWDIPKYFVAFGMILTLFENQAEVATGLAAQYQDLFEANLAAVYVATFGGKLLDCNSAFLQMYGFPSKHAALQSRVDLLHADASSRREFLHALERDGTVLNFECRQRRRDGTMFWILERARVVTQDEGERVIEGTAIDITERKQAELALKQSEERFATIFRQSPVGCAIVSLEGYFLNVNDYMLRTLCMTPEEIIGRTATDLGLWHSQQQRDEFYVRLRAEGSLHNLEVSFRDRNGNKHEGLYFATLVRIGDKECIFGMLLDQTEKRELEAKFLQSQKMESLGRLAGGVAHDFNNLLGVIGGYAELLEAKLANDNYRRYCTRIIETTQRGSSLTRQLLTFSRKEIIRPTPLRPDHVIRDVSGILPRLIGEDVELMVDLRSSWTVVMDKTHLEQIILNVVINARDAMPSGGQLFVETEDVFRPGISRSGTVDVQRFVAVHVRDTGIGMDEETLHHVFEPFYTTKETGRGTGLGLSTVYGIIQQTQGEISIESQPGRGTQIHIMLPAVDAVDVVTPEPRSIEVKRGTGKILLVEDEPALGEANAEFLRSVGYSVECAGGGPEGLRIAHDDASIDLVITDVIMPRMSGHEFAESLLEFRPGIKLLFVSGYAGDALPHNGIAANGTPFLQKPFSLKQLADKVHELLGAPSTQMQAESSRS